MEEVVRLHDKVFINTGFSKEKTFIQDFLKMYKNLCRLASDYIRFDSDGSE
jgi:hypothetical protein